LTPDEADGVEYLESGRVRIRVGSQEWTLRTPLIGEIKEFRKQLAAADEAGVAAPTGEGTTAQSDGVLAAIRWVVKSLNGRDLPPTEELPVWCGSVNLSQQLITHWQTVPLLSGIDPRLR
jgi:hypothetical protein